MLGKPRFRSGHAPLSPHLDLKLECLLPIGLSECIDLPRGHPPTTQRAVHQKIQRVEAGYLKPLDRPLNPIGEMLRQASYRHLISQPREMFGLPAEDRHIDAVTLVTRARMREASQRHATGRAVGR